MGSHWTKPAMVEQDFPALKISASKEGINEPPKDFPLFSFLPTEIRLKIWDEAFQNLPGRIVILQEFSEGSRLKRARFFCKRPAPSLAHVCREASSIVRSRNLFFIENTSNPFFEAKTSHTQICFDIEKDTLLLGPQFRMKQIKRLENSVPEETLKRLKHLAIEFGFRRHHRGSSAKWDFQPLGLGRFELERFCEAFPALERLVMVPHHSYLGEGSDCFRGELKFEHPKELGWEHKEWVDYVSWARNAYLLELERLIQRHWKPLAMRIPMVEFTSLALVGGDMERCWDPVMRKNFWKLADKENKNEQ